MKIVSLGSLTKIKTGKLDANANDPNGEFPFFTCSREALKINNYSYDCECVLVAGNGDLNVKYYNGKFDAYQRTYIIESVDKQILSVKYLYYFMERYVSKLREMAIGGVIKYIKLSHLTEAKIPIPNIEKQNAIVEMLERASKLITLREAQIELLDELLKSVFIKMFGDPITNPKDFPRLNLKEFGKVITGNTPSRKKAEYYGNYIEWIKSDNITTDSHYLTTAEEYLSEIGSEKGRIVPPNSILVTCIAGSKSSIGKAAIANRRVAFNQQINAIIPNKNINVYFLYTQFLVGKKLVQQASTNSMKGLVSKSAFENVEFIYPPYEKQKQFEVYFLKIKEKKNRFLESLNYFTENYNSLMQHAFKGELIREFV